MSTHLSVGVIGHVDHGKTSLVKALSGIDTDRLKEEKERGMSIVLGFAHLEIGDAVIDLIDAPGHENFVRTMIAGATGIEAVLLVVDVREGVKPQTREHLAITELIGIRRGVVALTKCDLASASERAAALKHLRTLLKGSYLAYAPIVFTSAETGEGLEELKHTLRSLCAPQTTAVDDASFYLPIDRVFSIPGRGTVVTGTLRRGSLRVGDEVELMPAGMRVTVRQLQFHGKPVEIAFPGQRVGVNLRQLKLQEVERGDALASMGLIQTSALLDAQLTLLNSQDKALCDGQTYRLLFGTTEVGARLRLLSHSALEPGQSGIVQLQTVRPVAAIAGEPFILRRESPPETVGGGRLLNPAAMRHRRSDAQALARLQALAQGSEEQRLVERLKAAGYGGTSIRALAAALGATEAQVKAQLTEEIATPIDETHVLYRPFLDALADQVFAALIKFHRQHPTRAGAQLSVCRAAVPRSVSEGVFRMAVRRLCSSKRAELHGGLICSYGYDPFSALDEDERRTAVLMESSVRQGGMTPPDVEDLVHGKEGNLALLHLLVERGDLVLLPAEQAGRKIVFHCDAIKEAGRRMCQAFPPPRQFTVSELRGLLGSTRKFTVPLLEYFDSAGYTRRYGDKRVVAGDKILNRSRAEQGRGGNVEVEQRR